MWNSLYVKIKICCFLKQHKVVLLFGFASFLYSELCVYIFILGYNFGFLKKIKTVNFLYKTSKQQLLIYVLYFPVENVAMCVTRWMRSFLCCGSWSAFLSPWVVWPDFRVELEQSFMSWDALPRLCNVTIKTKQTCYSTTSFLFLLYPN